MSAELPPLSAPECATTYPVPFMTIDLQGIGVSPPVTRSAGRARVLARGFELPEERTTLPSGAASAAQVGWLRLEVIADTALSDAAGESSADSGGPDAGALNTADAGPTTGGAPAILVGRREIGELPVQAGDLLDFTFESVNGGLWHRSSRRITLQHNATLLLFHQDDGGFDAFGGFSHTSGDAACAWRNEAFSCVDYVRLALVVGVPGGATATLAPGEARTVGDYRVFHGATDSFVRLHTNSTCDDDLLGGPNLAAPP